jgi:photosystem II stability/assembly factor-like uncharacterized protein
MLLVGTRKGCFVLESTPERRDWEVRGPYCDGWPVYRATYDHGTGTIYAAAASEWHGAGVWRSSDMGETWQVSSEGLGYGEDSGLRLSKISGLAASHGRLLAGAEAAGLFESLDGGETWSLLSTLDDQPGREVWNDPANQPPGHLGMPAILADPQSRDHYWIIIQGIGIFETTDNGATWTPRNRGLRAAWPREHDEVGFCVHKLVMSPADHDRMYQQNHCGMHRSDDGGMSWTEITEGLPTDFGFAAAAHPHDRDSFYVIPLDPGHGRMMPDGHAAVWRTSDAGSSWRRLDQGLPHENAHLGVLREGMAIDHLDSPGLYFGTSTGQLFASTDEGDSWSEIASYLPAIASVDVAVIE